MDIDGAFPGTFLKAADLNGQSVKVKIASVVMEEVGNETKPIVYFQGKQLGLVLNKTNARSISMLHGRETDGWIGKEIEIYPTETDFQGDRVACIRVKQGKAPLAEEDIPF